MQEGMTSHRRPSSARYDTWDALCLEKTVVMHDNQQTKINK